MYKLKITKLNQNGFDHVLTAVAFVVITAIVGTGYFVISYKGHSTASNGHAYALGNGSSGQLCTTDNGSRVCLNAWNGGPWIRAYNSYAGNNDMEIYQSNGFWLIADVAYNTSSYAKKCIGDSDNDKNISGAYLDTCGTGYGTYFNATSCAGGKGLIFQNRHWGGYLGPIGSSNGSFFTLNSSTPYCYQIIWGLQ